MKKLSVILATIFISASTAFAATFHSNDSDERPITFEQLPAEAQNFIKSYFSPADISYAIIDKGIFFDDYSVMFTNGDKLEFDDDGKWTEVQCRKSAVPQAIVPKQIVDYVKQYYPTATINEIKRDRNEWEVKLSGGLEFKFNSSFRLVEVDD